MTAEGAKGSGPRPRTVDRSIARMVAMKRMVTGTLSIAVGIGLIVVVAVQHHAVTAPVLLALTIFFAGGGWTLRDGLRLRRELRK